MTDRLQELLARKRDLPKPHADFLSRAIPLLAGDERLVGVAAGGSFTTGTMDEYSDLDLIIAAQPAYYDEVMRQRRDIAVSLGSLLAAFTGEHVGEPRVLICLFGPPLLHVDLKFVNLQDAADRVEDPTILWERESRLSAVIESKKASFPVPDLQWIEDRFWVWIHYGATKLGRGELFEALDFLAFLRLQVLGPLALQAEGALPSGVRKVESDAPRWVDDLRRTVGAYDRVACLQALEASADLYRYLRSRLSTERLSRRSEAEREAMAYVKDIKARIAR